MRNKRMYEKISKNIEKEGAEIDWILKILKNLKVFSIILPRPVEKETKEILEKLGYSVLNSPIPGYITIKVTMNDYVDWHCSVPRGWKSYKYNKEIDE